MSRIKVNPSLNAWGHRMHPDDLERLERNEGGVWRERQMKEPKQKQIYRYGLIHIRDRIKKLERELRRAEKEDNQEHINFILADLEYFHDLEECCKELMKYVR